MKYFTDKKILKIHKDLGLKPTKNSISTLHRLVNNYITYYIKSASQVASMSGGGIINGKVIQLVKKLNHETNVYHHTHFIEKMGKQQSGGNIVADGNLDLLFNSTGPHNESINQALIERRFSEPVIGDSIHPEFMSGGGGRSKPKLLTRVPGLKTMQKYVDSFTGGAIKLDKGGLKDLHYLAENFVIKASLKGGDAKGRVSGERIIKNL